MPHLNFFWQTLVSFTTKAFLPYIIQIFPALQIKLYFSGMLMLISDLIDLDDRNFIITTVDFFPLSI